MEEQEADFRVRRKIAPCFLFMFHGLKITSLKYQYSKELMRSSERIYKSHGNA
jgi:hypothetical protein